MKQFSRILLVVALIAMIGCGMSAQDKGVLLGAGGGAATTGFGELEPEPPPHAVSRITIGKAMLANSILINKSPIFYLS